jgi:hypothetical protein
VPITNARQTDRGPLSASRYIWLNGNPLFFLSLTTEVFCIIKRDYLRGSQELYWLWLRALTLLPSCLPRRLRLLTKNINLSNYKQNLKQLLEIISVVVIERRMLEYSMDFILTGRKTDRNAG